MLPVKDQMTLAAESGLRVRTVDEESVDSARTAADPARNGAGAPGDAAQAHGGSGAGEEALATALRQLAEAREQLRLREKLASLGALTAGIAHELRNPLNFITNFATLTVDLVGELAEEMGPEARDNAALAELLDSIRDNVVKIGEHGQRADRIIQAMLVQSRAGGGARGPTDINKVVAESLNLAFHSVRARSPGCRVDLQASYDPALPTIEADGAALARVFLNLFDNALYVTLRKQETAGPGYKPTVGVTTSALEHVVEIRIFDNGTGISKENAARLFTEFFTTKPPGEGVGLGLSICHEVITRGHGGTIGIDSVDGERTEFIITLPRR